MTGVYARARELESTISASIATAAATATELASVTVTLDGLKVPSAARVGVVVVVPPRVELPTFTQLDTEWSVLVVAGPVDRLDVAWERLDAIVGAVLTSGLPFETLEPDSYVTAQGARLPCYVLKFTETIHP